MKTAISLDGPLMEQADRVARELGMSRSGLIAEALRDYLRRRRQKRVLEQLNQAYAQDPTPAERLLVRRLKTKVPRTDRW